MVKALKSAVVAAIFLCPFVSPHSAFARTFLSYQEAVWMCGTGDLEACDAMHAYEAGPRGAKSGPKSSQDFVK
jgi:hypothetical protein